MQNMQMRIGFDQLFRQLTGAIRRIIINDQKVSFRDKMEHLFHQLGQIFTLVVGGNADEKIVGGRGGADTKRRRGDRRFYHFSSSSAGGRRRKMSGLASTSWT